MKDLRFYDFEFNLLHIEHDFSSVYWNLKYNGIGTFEAEFASSGILNALCAQKKYLIVCQGEQQAIITNRQLKNNILRLYGRTVNFLLTKRTIAPFSTENLEIKKDSVSLAQYVINESCADFIVFGSSVEAAENGEFSRNTMQTCSDVITDCLNKDSLGHKLVFDFKNKQWIFHIIKGEEKQLVLSDENLNCFDSEYTQSLLDYITSGYYYQKFAYKGEWDPVNNSPTLFDKMPENYTSAYRVNKDATYFNTDFKEGDYLICKSPDGSWEKSNEADGFWVYIEGEKQGVYRWDSVLSADGESEAKTIISGKKVVQKGTARIRNLQFGEDFNLGDIITFSQKTGDEITSFRQRISAVSIWFEKGNAGGIKPEFTEI